MKNHNLPESSLKLKTSIKAFFFFCSPSVCFLFVCLNSQLYTISFF